MFKPLNVIVCCDKKNGIGLKNQLPWNIKSEMKIFKVKTIGSGNNCVIMGKNTYFSVPEKFRPLKNRHNYIVSSTFQENNDGVYVLRNLEEELEQLLRNSSYDKYWIIGGESIYHKIIKDKPQLIDEIHISILDNDYNCDAFFPKIDCDIFKLVNETYHNEDKYFHYVYKNTAYAS